jgi:hypothetical protein
MANFLKGTRAKAGQNGNHLKTEWKSFKESDFALENSAVIQFS